jgi:hypothetical protein
MCTPSWAHRHCSRSSGKQVSRPTNEALCAFVKLRGLRVLLPVIVSVIAASMWAVPTSASAGRPAVLRRVPSPVIVYSGSVLGRSSCCAARATVAREAFHFKSPSGNIHCRMDAEGVGCLLRKSDWPRLPVRPRGCDVDWFPTDIGMSFNRRVRRWQASVGGCRGDVGPLCLTGSLRCFVLKYGHAVMSVTTWRGRRLGVRCNSAKNGITCTPIGRDAGVHGFRVAYENYVIF